ncbi:DUF1761 domain-containing protein [Phenylobacterium sp.]|uniref:DUF1761 domain-containing protein n=1 Tax=Phenylobacterium sp. TaxID=1871053 RepID=UPI002DF068EC|nr:DUF1761 domain-containing protein [Phenylobacterium sp.]
MNWTHLALVVVVSGVVASITDYVFMGLLFKAKYQEAPEIWRQGTSETRKIIYSELIGLITCAAFAWLLSATGHVALMSGVKMAVAVWVILAIPILFTNSLWIRLSPYIAASHAVGWLVRLLVTAAAVSYLL